MNAAVSVLFAMAEYIAYQRAWCISWSSYTGWTEKQRSQNFGWKNVGDWLQRLRREGPFSSYWGIQGCGL